MAIDLPTTTGGWPVIYADPPWNFKSNSIEKPGRNARRHYDCMSLSDIAAMRVAEITAQDATLFLWITGPMLVIGAHFPIMKAWGFKPSAIGFTWIKLNRKCEGNLFSHDDIFMGGGFTTRKNAEFCLIGRKGKSMRKSASVREVIVSPVLQHSRKPDETRKRIEAYCDGPRLELFARETCDGWASVGNETTKFNESTGGEQAQPLPAGQHQREGHVNVDGENII